jgi:hypothetical protein
MKSTKSRSREGKKCPICRESENIKNNLLIKEDGSEKLQKRFQMAFEI